MEQIAKVRQWIHGMMRWSLDFLYPRYCVFCLQDIRATDYLHICQSCRNALMPRNSMNICTHCGALAKGFSELGVFFLREGASCSYCRKRNFRFRCVKCLWNFQGLPRKWIHQLKYYDGEYLVADLEKILSEYSEWYEYLAHAVLVPVPLHWRRHWQRDYNQSHLIARTMAKVSGAFMVPLLSRCKFSRSQTELTRCERWSSVQGVFTVNRRAKGINRNHRVILVDDVLTTGATLHECATVLHENGFECVDVAVLAHG